MTRARIGSFRFAEALIVLSLSAPHHVAGQAQAHLAVVRGMDLDTQHVGRVTAHAVPADRDRALQLATLLNDAATKFDRDLGLVFPIELAVLRPDDWFSDIPGIPYAIPWPSMNERLIVTPSSLEEGLLVERRSRGSGERLVNFVTLHEYGHLAAKEYFRPGDREEYIPVQWFRELLATYFAYSYVASTDPAWAASARQEWRDAVDAFEPKVLSLDWGFMNAMEGRELAATYEWYQFLLNLRAAELYESHGLGLLPVLKRLPWDRARDWSHEGLLEGLDDVAPELAGWARAFGKRAGAAGGGSAAIPGTLAW